MLADSGCTANKLAVFVGPAGTMMYSIIFKSRNCYGLAECSYADACFSGLVQ